MTPSSNLEIATAMQNSTMDAINKGWTCTPSDYESPGMVAFTVIKTLITIIGLLSNLTTFTTLALHSKGFTKVNRLLLQHQAIADTGVCIMGIVYYTQSGVWMTDDSTFNFLVCQFWHTTYIYWAGAMLSVWNVVFITLERFILINYPLKHRNIRPSHINLGFALIYVWVIVSMGPAFTLRRYDVDKMECLDELLFDSKELRDLIMSFATVFFFVIYGIPIVIFAALYSKTLLTLRQKREANQESNILKKQTSI